MILKSHSNLRETIRWLKLTEIEAMNDLQNFGVISDNAIKLDDIALCNLSDADAWLKRNLQPTQELLFMGAASPHFKLTQGARP